MKKRDEIWKDLEARQACTVLILGGGVNGTGLFRDLAFQGIDCVLVDKADFTAGASSKSSRMIHGGLRYLENAEFKLVKEAVFERNRLLRRAPHYVAPLKTSIPINSWFAGLIRSPLVFLGLPVKVGGRGALIVKMGLAFYDMITGRHRQTPKHYLLSKKRSLEEMPGLRDNIACTATYWDAWISQAERLCVEMIEEGCREHDACAAINYVSASRRDGDTVALKDALSGRETPLQPGIVVNATGAWVDYANRTLGIESQFMGGTKGSHLILDNKRLYDALGDRMIYYEHTDGRVCITFRFMDRVLMGSTDIRVENPDDAVCEEQEVEYMMSTLQGVFPGIPISRDDIVFTFCGVRPLPSSGLDFTSRVPRSHRIEVSEPDDARRFPVYSMIGGKLTTFGAFATQTADLLLQRLNKTRRADLTEQPYLGARDYPADDAARRSRIEALAGARGIDGNRVAALFERYGSCVEEMLEGADASWHQPLETLPDYCAGEIRYIAERECIAHLSDIVRRRSVITLLGHANEKTLRELADVAGAVLGWDEERREQEIEMALTEAKDGR